MKIIKQKEGITLIALIITIIIMLILAGVSISLITGEDGLFIKADVAAKEYKQQSIIEVVKNAGMLVKLDNKGALNIDEFYNKLNGMDSFNKEDYDITQDEDENTITIIDKTTGIVVDITIDENGEVIVEGTVVDDIANAVKPVITYELDPTSEIYAETVKIKVTVTEEKNGIARIQLPDNTIQNSNNKKTVNIEYSVIENGTYKFTAVSANGRKSSISVEVKNSMSAADIKIELPDFPDEVKPTKGPVQVKIKYDPNVKILGQTLTNEDRYQYQIENGEIKTATTSETTITVNVNETITAWYYDGKNRFKIATIDIQNIDLDAPTTATITASDVSQTTFTLIATGADATSTTTSKSSGIAKYEFYVNGILEKTVETTEQTATYNATGKTAGTSYDCMVRVYDAVGRYKDSETISVGKYTYTLNYVTKSNYNYNYTLTSSANNDANRTPDKIFDGSINELTGCWHSPNSSNQWLKIAFDEQVEINTFTIQNRDGSVGYNISNFYLQASNDDSTWITLQEFTNPTTSGTKTEFNITYDYNNHGYKYYRWYAPYSGYVVIGEMEIEFCTQKKYEYKNILNYITKSNYNYTLTSSANNDANRTPDKIFDGSINELTGCWHSPNSSNQWLKIAFDEQVEINTFTIQNRTAGYNISNFYLQASNDDSTWITLQEFTNPTTSGTKTEFNVTYDYNNHSYKYYRWYAPYSGYVVIGEMEIEFPVKTDL